jgi:hypothetical protein
LFGQNILSYLVAINEDIVKVELQNKIDEIFRDSLIAVLAFVGATLAKQTQGVDRCLIHFASIIQMLWLSSRVAMVVELNGGGACNFQRMREFKIWRQKGMGAFATRRNKVHA